jgi:hypothetical protein
MLERISQLKNIGRFSCPERIGNIEFGKITVIFGRNTYGKSTLGDLFSSLASGNLESIIARRTIPYDGKAQNAELLFQLNDMKKLPIRLNNGGWQPILNNLKLCVFDDGFYHNNVFAARQFTRDTKEKFSAFALGSQGVIKANKIAEKKQLKGKLTRERSSIEKLVFKDIENLFDFLRLTPPDSIDTIDSKINELREKWSAINRQRKNAALIIARNNCDFVHREDNLEQSLQQLNSVLQTSLNSYHKEARQKVTEHIEKLFKGTQNAENWIRQGLTQNLGESCQFCGQPLSKEALELLDVYRQTFDATFEQHESTVKKELEKCRIQLTNENISDLKFVIERNKTALVSYHEIEMPEFINLKNLLFQFEKQLEQLFEFFIAQNLTVKKNLDIVISQKLESPHIVINKINFNEYLETNSNIKKIAQQYNAVASNLNTILQNFKNSVQYDSLSKTLSEIEFNANIEKRKRKRLELSEQCSKYLILDEEIKKLNEEIPRLQSELEQEQSSFLDQFFTRINQYFREFGSRDFTLEKGKNTLGNTPIYYLKVKFNGKSISENDLERVFSESDRRALSLAVFWASLTSINEE